MQARRLRLLLTLSAVLLLAAVLGAGIAYAADPEQSQTGPAVDKVYFKAFHVDRAPLDLAQGNMDLYLFGLKTAAATELRDSDDLQIFEAPATTLSIILNPAEAPEGQLNPFSIRDVRWALQHLVNREFVAGEIFRGMADPMVTHISPSDFDQLTVFDLIRELNIRYDPEFARSLINEAMTGAGAEMRDGFWHYNDRPIRLKFIIRIEDERREIGDLVRAELREAGFQVDPVYQNFAPAILTVYASNPQAFQWHLYTEGWGRSAPNRYDYSSINQFTAPWTGGMPGWREAGYWQYENDELDEIGQRIFTGQFSNEGERNALYEQATRIAVEDSIRVWVATVQNSFAANKALTGVTQDLVAGPKAPWTLREAEIPGQSELTVGHLWVWTERTTWNPVGGFGDVYSTDIWRNLNDPPIWNHPFSGVPQPVRASFEVETAGPSGTLTVPADAVMVDPPTDTWKAVGAGTQATSKVTFDYSKYFSAEWHHGIDITMADVLYSIYQGFDLAYDDDKSKVERALAVTARPFLDTFKGIRVLDENRLEVYVDFWHFEENYIASYASPSSVSMPWEMLAAMDDLVFEQRRAAYSDTAASRFDVPWISLVQDRDARLVRTTLLGFQREGKVPEGVFTDERQVAGLRGRGAGALPGRPRLVQRAQPHGHQQRALHAHPLRPTGAVCGTDGQPAPGLPLLQGRLQLRRGGVRATVRDPVDAAADRRGQHPDRAGGRPGDGGAPVHPLRPGGEQGARQGSGATGLGRRVHHRARPVRRRRPAAGPVPALPGRLQRRRLQHDAAPHRPRGVAGRRGIDAERPGRIDHRHGAAGGDDSPVGADCAGRAAGEQRRLRPRRADGVRVRAGGTRAASA